MSAIDTKDFRLYDPFPEMGEPDSLLPSQFVDRIVPALSSQPEKRLMLAVLHNAIAIFQTCWLSRKRRDQRLFREAEEWLFANDTAWPFSFANICNALNFDADCLRKGLADWQARQMALRVRKATLGPLPVHLARRQGQSSASGTQSDQGETFLLGRMFF